MFQDKKSGVLRNVVNGRTGFRFARKLPVIALLAAGAMQASWGASYAAWAHSQPITITPGTGVTAAVKNFPVLVFLTSANASVFSSSRADGLDVQFTAADGSTPLSFQRQSYNPTAKTAEFWVLVPSIAANPATTSIRMYWDNINAKDAQNAAATFDTAAGYNYRAVWHMSAASGNEPDQTKTGHDLVPASGAAPTLSTGGPVGAGNNYSFDGATQYFTANNSGGTSSSLIFPQGGPLTISAWINPTNSDAGEAILGKINTGAVSTWTGSYGWVYNGSTAGDLRFNDEEGAAGFERCDYAINSGSWTHVVWVLQDTGTTATSNNVYINGVLSGTTGDANNTTATSRTDSLSFTIGADAGLSGITSTFWQGNVQEVQIANVAWSPSWIALAYQNQSTPSNLLSFGTVATLKADGLMAARPQLSLRGNALDYVVSKAAPVEITFYDMSGKVVLDLNRSESAGSHTVQLNKMNLAQGAYLVGMKTAGFEKTLTVNITR
jgi:biopolymer transport protein ExbB